jgi:hypothetical protein
MRSIKVKVAQQFNETRTDFVYIPYLLVDGKVTGIAGVDARVA